MEYRALVKTRARKVDEIVDVMRGELGIEHQEDFSFGGIQLGEKRIGRLGRGRPRSEGPHPENNQYDQQDLSRPQGTNVVQNLIHDSS
jgi:hypothetical protein